MYEYEVKSVSPADGQIGNRVICLMYGPGDDLPPTGATGWLADAAVGYVSSFPDVPVGFVASRLRGTITDRRQVDAMPADALKPTLPTCTVAAKRAARPGSRQR